MMEAVVGGVGGTMIDKTVEILSGKIEKAKNTEIEIVKRCQIYLEAASVAIQGLENEHDAILNQAEICRLDQRQQTQGLEKRILDYLSLDRFRGVLWDVHEGLKGCRTALQNNNERLLILPGVRGARQDVITNFISTLESLEQYISDLQNAGLEYRLTYTGVAIKWLIGIKDDYLSIANSLHDEAASPSRRELAKLQNELIEYVNLARQDRSKDKLEHYTIRIRRTVEKLLQVYG
mgnify:CR=1 FL=1